MSTEAVKRILSLDGSQIVARREQCSTQAGMGSVQMIPNDNRKQEEISSRSWSVYRILASRGS